MRGKPFISAFESPIKWSFHRRDHYLWSHLYLWFTKRLPYLWPRSSKSEPPSCNCWPLLDRRASSRPRLIPPAPSPTTPPGASIADLCNAFLLAKARAGRTDRYYKRR